MVCILGLLQDLVLVLHHLGRGVGGGGGRGSTTQQPHRAQVGTASPGKEEQASSYGLYLGTQD
jgi:hypothetical protein